MPRPSAGSSRLSSSNDSSWPLLFRSSTRQSFFFLDPHILSSHDATHSGTEDAANNDPEDVCPRLHILSLRASSSAIGMTDQELMTETFLGSTARTTCPSGKRSTKHTMA